MKIKLDDTFWIDASDELNFTLMRKRDGKSKEGNDIEVEEELGYYGNIGHALKMYMKYAVNTKYKNQIITLEEYENACLNILEDVLKIIPKKL